MLQCSLASSDGKGRCIACDGHDLNAAAAAASGQGLAANGRVPARGRPSSDVADVITGRFASQSGQLCRGASPLLRVTHTIVLPAAASGCASLPLRCTVSLAWSSFMSRQAQTMRALSTSCSAPLRQAIDG
jgi:hypothetical protein